MAEFERWFEDRAAPVRPPASQVEYMREALARGLTADEALRLIDGLVEAQPEMTRAKAFGWMLGHWRD